MRHRIGIAASTGLGNPEKELLDNVGKINKKFADAGLKQYFSKEDGFDFKITKKSISIGIEPAYQGDQLKIVSIHKNKRESFIMTGFAKGYYGSGLVVSKKRYHEYSRKCKFLNFVDKWHPVLFPSKEKS